MSNANRIFSDVADATVLPKIVRIKENLYAVAFVLMKLLPAKFILQSATDDGLINDETVVLESTSGTFGLALALVCNQQRRRFIMVSDPAVDAPLKRRLEDLGAEVEICPKPAARGGYQRARLERLRQYQEEHRNHFWPAQYKNPRNPGAYSLLAELLLEHFGNIDCLVGTVGSGGSMCGTSTYLRTVNPNLHTIGVDTHNSVLFGRPDGPRVIRGLGNSLMPPNLSHTAFDDIHWLNGAEMILATRLLHRRHGMFCGPTSGAAYQVALHHAERHPSQTVVFLCPDEGYRYQDTVYNDQWLESSGLLLGGLPEAPKTTDLPAAAPDVWSHINWNRRTLPEVLGHASPVEVAV
jgi:S-sulfo-L-cysteine synthase (3-phospho-L-serine-dependent)